MVSVASVRTKNELVFFSLVTGAECNPRWTDSIDNYYSHWWRSYYSCFD